MTSSSSACSICLSPFQEEDPSSPSLPGGGVIGLSLWKEELAHFWLLSSVLGVGRAALEDLLSHHGSPSSWLEGRCGSCEVKVQELVRHHAEMHQLVQQIQAPFRKERKTAALHELNLRPAARAVREALLKKERPATAEENPLLCLGIKTEPEDDEVGDQDFDKTFEFECFPEDCNALEQETDEEPFEIKPHLPNDLYTGPAPDGNVPNHATKDGWGPKIVVRRKPKLPKRRTRLTRKKGYRNGKKTTRAEPEAVSKRKSISISAERKRKWKAEPSDLDSGSGTGFRSGPVKRTTAKPKKIGNEVSNNRKRKLKEIATKKSEDFGSESETGSIDLHDADSDWDWEPATPESDNQHHQPAQKNPAAKLKKSTSSAPGSVKTILKKCLLCPSLTFSSVAAIQEHRITEHSVGYNCYFEGCRGGFATPYALEQHVRKTHHDPTTFQCKGCGKLCPGRDDFFRHLRNEDAKDACRSSGLRCLKCKCTRSFENEKALEVHDEVRHQYNERKGLPFKCKVCGKGFSRMQDFPLHVKSHTEDVSVMCEICGVRISPWSLHSHMSSVHGEAKYKCRICNKGFTTGGKRTRHEKLHGDECPYLCSICGKGFKLKEYLTLHYWSHDPDRHSKYSLYMYDRPKKAMTKKVTRPRVKPTAEYKDMNSGNNPAFAEPASLSFPNPYGTSGIDPAAFGPVNPTGLSVLPYDAPVLFGSPGGAFNVTSEMDIGKEKRTIMSS